MTVLKRKCGNSSVGRAQPCQGWGREFESRFPLQAGQHIAGLLFFIQRTRTRDPLPEGAAGQGRLRGLRKKSRHARVREFESRFPLQAGQHIAGLLFLQRARTCDLLPEGAAGQGRLRGLRKKSRHARVRGLESRFPLQAGQHIAGLLFLYRGLELATRSPRELPAGPAEASTEKSSVNKRDRR